MAEDPKTPAAPAGDNGGIDIEQITKAAVDAATKAAAAAVSQAIAPLTQKVETLQADLGKVASPEAIAAVVSEQLSATQADQAKKAQREKYIQDKLADVPAAYLAQLGDDPAKFGEQEQAIRTQLQADLAKLGVKASNLGGAAGSGGDQGQPKKVTDAIDTSKLSGMQLIQMGVEQTMTRASAPADNATTTPDAPAANK